MAEAVKLTGHLRFENGPIDVFKRGFKLCATQIGCTIGVSGRLDCDRFVPTAGRDSLDSATTSLLDWPLCYHLFKRIYTNCEE